VQDGALCDEELNAFQVLCFNQPLQQEELQMLKDVGRAPGQQSTGLAWPGCMHPGRLATWLGT
jgi:hypothetical protein